MIEKTSRYIFLLLCLSELVHVRITEVAPEDQDRIVGGHEVSPPHKYPFQVNKVNLKLSNEKLTFQVYFASGHYACGGSGINIYLVNKLNSCENKYITSVLDKHHILTAAHCVYDPETGNLQV